MLPAIVELGVSMTQALLAGRMGVDAVADSSSRNFAPIHSAPAIRAPPLSPFALHMKMGRGLR
jgi:hypothetical protein